MLRGYRQLHNIHKKTADIHSDIANDVENRYFKLWIR